jgi:hypothetical protein
MSTTQEIEKTSEYYKYIFQAWKAPKATDDTRVALVAHQLGLSDQDLEQFYYVNRKGASKRHFAYSKFAEKYGISVDWLRHGYLPAHPRHLKPLKTVRRSKKRGPEERAPKAAAKPSAPAVLDIPHGNVEPPEIQAARREIERLFHELDPKLKPVALIWLRHLATGGSA